MFKGFFTLTFTGLADAPVCLGLNLSEVMRPADCQIPLNAHTDDHVDARNNTDPGKTLIAIFNSMSLSYSGKF